jgi:hemoglobin
MNKTAQPAPSVTSVTGAVNPHFERIGGVDGITRLVERFYFHMDTLPAAAGIRVMHPADLRPIKRVLINYLTEWTGGPQLYSQERGHPRLRRKHMAFAIGPAERDAWMACMHLALDEAVSDATLKAQLAQAFMKTADFIRNDQGHQHEPH